MGNDINSLKAAIIALQEEVKELKTSIPVANLPLNNAQFEEIIQEVHERHRRESNIIIFEAAEQPSIIAKGDRVIADRSDVGQILKTLVPNFNSDHISLYRLGRFDPERSRPRPIKVTLNNKEQVQEFIRKAKSLQNYQQFKHISLAFDRTPKQIEYYQQIKKELESRKSNGENLKIQYVHGIPKIVTLN